MRPEAPIERVEAAAYRIPTDGPEADGTLAWDATSMVVCEVEAGGQTGFAYGYANRATALFAHEVLRPVLEHREALDTAARWRGMVDQVRNHGRQGVAAMAISVCDAALHDLRGKLLDAPLSALFGRCRDAVPLYGSGGFTTYDDAALEAQLGGWAADGFRAVKMKIGADVEAEAARVRRARDMIGGEVALMVDANGACSRKQALALAHRIAEAGVVYFEEPVSSDDLEGLRLLRDAGPPGMDIAAGEYGYDAFHFRALLDAGAVDVLQADATRCCGLTGLMQADALAFAANVPLSIHCAPALHLQAALCLQRLMHQEWFHDHARIERMLLDGAPVARHGVAAPASDAPGLGLALKAADAEQYRVWPTGPS